MTNAVSPSTRFPTTPWQSEKMLHDDDKVVILTDIEREFSSYYSWSEPQELFRVGIYDLRTECIGFAKFGRDLAFDMIKGGVPVAPWGAGMFPLGVEIHRSFHGSQPEGRFVGKVACIEVGPVVLALTPAAQRRFRQAGHSPDVLPGIWCDLEARAKSELAIEKAALGMSGVFKAGNIRAIVGDDKRITRVLQRLVREERLTLVSAKKYCVAPLRIIERGDWTD